MGDEQPLRSTQARMIQAHLLRPQLTALARRLLTSPHDVDDAVAEAVLAAEASTATDVGELHAYLQLVLRGAARELRRQPPLAQAARLAGTVRTVETNPAVLVCDRAEDTWLTHEALADLSVREREVVELRADGLTLRQIASKLGITCRTAEVHLHQARRKVRARLAQTWGAALPAVIRFPRTVITALRRAHAPRSVAPAVPALVLGALLVVPALAPRQAPPGTERDEAAFTTPPTPSIAVRLPRDPEGIRTSAALEQARVHAERPGGDTTGTEKAEGVGLLPDMRGSDGQSPGAREPIQPSRPRSPAQYVRDCLDQFTVPPTTLGCQ